MAKLNLKGFKKVSADEATIVFKNDHGHEIKVARRALSRELRAAADALPVHLADGGEIPPQRATSYPLMVPAMPGQIGPPLLFNYAPPVAQPGPQTEADMLAQDAGRLRSLAEAHQYMDALRHAPAPAIAPDEAKPKRGGYAEGGEVAPEEMQREPARVLDPALVNSVAPFIPGVGPAVMGNQIAQGLQALPGMVEQAGQRIGEAITVPNPTLQGRAPQEAPEAAPMGGPAQVPPQAPAIPGADFDPRKALSRGQAGIQYEAQATGELGKQQAAIQQQYIDHMAAAQSHYEADVKENLAERDALKHDIENGHVDPRRFWADKTTGQRFAAALGVILGGIGAGLTHRDNDALKVINSQIEQDIDAQKQKLQDKTTLLHANLQRFKDIDTAAAVTKMQYLTMAQAQLSKASALAASPLAKAQAEKASAALEMQYGPLLALVAQKTAVAKAIQGGGLSDPRVAALAVETYVPKEHRVEAMKQLKSAQDVRNMEGNILSSFDQATRENTIAGRATRLGQEPASVKAFKLNAMAPLKDIEGRVNETEIHTINDLAPAPGDTPARIATKRAGLVKYLQSKKSSPILSLIPGFNQGASAGTGGINFTPSKR